MKKISAVNMNSMPVMSSSYYYFSKARLFAGLFAVPQNTFCP